MGAEHIDAIVAGIISILAAGMGVGLVFRFLSGQVKEAKDAVANCVTNEECEKLHEGFKEEVKQEIGKIDEILRGDGKEEKGLVHKFDLLDQNVNNKLDLIITHQKNGG